MPFTDGRLPTLLILNELLILTAVRAKKGSAPSAVGKSMPLGYWPPLACAYGAAVRKTVVRRSINIEFTSPDDKPFASIVARRFVLMSMIVPSSGTLPFGKFAKTLGETVIDPLPASAVQTKLALANSLPFDAAPTSTTVWPGTRLFSN